MEINRSNYEIWFIDWLDGNLNNLQAEQLKLFLDQNPDLREELNDLTPVNTCFIRHFIPLQGTSEKIIFRHSRIPVRISMCSLLENDLNNSQQEELKEIVNTDPDRKKTFDLIQKTRLFPRKLQYKQKRLSSETKFTSKSHLGIRNRFKRRCRNCPDHNYFCR